jgi:hypothetical protein
VLDAGEAAVVFDALLERGEAAWPGVGRFALVAVTKERMDGSNVVHVFPTRKVVFLADDALAPQLKERGGRVVFPGLGTLSAEGFTPDEKLTGRMRVLPIQLFRAVVEPLKATGPELHRDERPWWRRIFGVD